MNSVKRTAEKLPVIIDNRLERVGEKEIQKIEMAGGVIWYTANTAEGQDLCITLLAPIVHGIHRLGNSIS